MALQRQRLESLECPGKRTLVLELKRQVRVKCLRDANFSSSHIKRKWKCVLTKFDDIFVNDLLIRENFWWSKEIHLLYYDDYTKGY